MAGSAAERISRNTLWVGAGAMGLVGVPAFFFPAWAATQFPWTVSPFLAMTIGGWAIGEAAFAFEAARRWGSERAIGVTTAAWLFGIAELVVVALFAGKIRIGLLTWPYLLGLVALTLSAVAGGFWLIRERPVRRSARAGLPARLRAVIALFAALVFLLALGTAIASEAGSITHGTVFPEPFSLFSARAFSAFFVSIASGAASLLLARSVAPVVEFARAGLVGLVAITIAALLNLELFDFAGHPLGMVYLGAYLVVGLAAFGLVITDPPPSPGRPG